MTPRILRIALVSASAALALHASAPAQDGPRPEVRTPEGAYALVHLEFSIPGAPTGFERWRYVGGMRDGRLPIDHGVGIRQSGGELRLADGELTGRFTRRQPVRGGGEAEIQVRAALDPEGTLAGTARIGEAEGTVRGRVIPEARLREEQAVDAEAGWPTFLGPWGGGTRARGPTPALVRRPDEIRFAWRAEETDIGQGIGSISRFMFNWRDATSLRTASGSSSPALADGRVFVSYYVPTATLPEPRQARFSTGHAPFERALERLVENAREAGAEVSADAVPAPALEKIWEGVDDVVLAIDAATGQTLWKAVMPARGYNLQHHKEGPFNMSPAVAEGRVFAIGMGGHLDAFAAATGEHLWTRRIGGERSHLSAAVLALPGVVVAPQGGVWRGFDPATGQDLWTSELRASNAAVAVWAHGGRHFLVSGTGSNLVWGGHGEDLACLDAATGEEQWRIRLTDDEQILAAVHSTGRGSGPGGIAVWGDTMVAYIATTSGESRTERRENMKHAAVAWRLTPEGPRQLWRIDDLDHNGEHVPVMLHGGRYVALGPYRGVQIHDLETGRLVSTGPEGIRPGNGGYMQGIGDLLLIRIDGTHGHNTFHFLRVDPEGAISALTADGPWTPPFGGGTSSYHHPLHYPLGDGRMFLRLSDGIYAYDLRAP